MKEWKGSGKKKIMRVLAAALAFCLLFTYPSALETLSVFAAGTPVEDGTLAEPTEEAEEQTVTVETAEQTVPTETAEQTAPVETAEQTAPLGTAAEQAIPVGTAAADLPQSDIADPAVQSLIDSIAALPDSEEYLANEPDAEAGEAYDQWMEGLHRYAGEAINMQEAYDELTAEQLSQIPAQAQEKLSAWVQTAMQIAGDSMETLNDSGTCGDNLTWTFDDAGTLTISGSGAMKDYGYDGDVPWNCYHSDITSIVISDTVTRIGNYAFITHNNNQLTSINIPNSVNSIGEYAFSSCTYLSSIVIPASVTSIEMNAFRGTPSLTSVTFTGSTPPTLGFNSYGNFPFQDSGCLSNNGIKVPCSWGDNFATSENGWVEYKDNVTKVHGTSESFDATPATCTTPGQNAGTKCKNCGTILSGGGTIAAKGHTYQYTASGDTITQDCNNGCGHSATATLSLSSTSFNYTGSEIKPTATVTCSDNWAGAKPTVKYANNINVGTAAEAYIEVSGKRASCYFTIKKKNPPLTVIKDDFAYGDNGSLTVNTIDGVGDRTVYYKPEGADDSAYTTTPPTDLGTYIVKVTLAENDEYNSISATDTFKILQENLNDTINISIGVDGATYTGDPVKPTVRVQHCKYTLSTKKEWVNLVEGTDYTVTCSNNTNVGTATVTVTGKGNYTGSVEKTFTITAASIGSAAVTLSSTTLTYNGSEQTKGVTEVIANGRKLIEGTDYTISGNVGTDAGEYTITITGINGYANSKKEVTFNIEPKPITNDMITVAAGPYSYTGSEIKPAVTIKDGEKTLTEGTDYTVTYSNNTDPGTAGVKIDGKGNYKGTFNKSFTIEYQPLPDGKKLEEYINVSPAPNKNGWYSSDIEITPKSGYGVGDTAAVKGSVIITAETDTDGDEKVIFIKDGDNIYKAKFPYKLDKTAPKVDLTDMTVENGDKVLDNYITGNSDMIIKIPESCITEPISGVAEVTYTAAPENGGEAKSGTITPNNGNYEIDLNDIVQGEEFVGTIQLTVKDKAGNTKQVTLPTASGKVIAEENTPTVKITPPDTPKPNENGWYSSPVTITVTVTDDKDGGGTAITSGGIAKIEYKDGEDGAVQTVAGLPGSNALVGEKEFTIPVNAEGTHTYYVRAVDNAGNESEWQTYTVKVDTGKPQFNGDPTVKNPTTEGADITLTPSEVGKAYWIVSDAVPTAEEVKAQSGQKGGVLDVEEGTEGSFTVTGLTPGEKHTVYVVLEDAAGNLSEVKDASFFTRQKAPDITLEDLNVDYPNETITLPDNIKGKVEIYTTDPSDPTSNPVTPSADGTLPIEPGTPIYIRYPEKTEDGLTTPASAGKKIDIPARPSAPSAKEVTVTDTTAQVTAPSSEEEYVLVPKDQTPDWSKANTTGQFSGLTPNKEYDLYARKKATDNSFVSDPVKKTIRTYVTINEPIIEGEGAGADGNTAPKPNKPNSDGTVTFTGTYSEEYTPVIKTGGKEIIPGDGTTDSEMAWDEENKKGTWEYTLTVPDGETEAEITVEFRKRKLTGIKITPDSLTIYADDPVNVSIDALNDYVKANSSVNAAYDNKTSGASLEASYTAIGSFEQKGKDYIHTATADAMTDNITLTVKPVTAAAEAPDKYSQAKRPEGYTAEEVNTWLPEQVTVTYSGDGYSARTEIRTVTWDISSIGSDFGTALGEKTVTGAVDLPSWATGGGSVSMTIDFIDKFVLKDDQIKIDLPDFSYGAPLPNPKGSVAVTDTNPTYDYLYSTDGGSTWVGEDSLPKSDSGYIIPGEYSVKVTYTGDRYIGEKTGSFTVEKKKLTILPGTFEVLDKNYDGTDIAEIKVGGTPALSGVVEGDKVTVGGSLSAVFTETGPESGIPVVVTGFILEGENAEYYEFREATLNLYATINYPNGMSPDSVITGGNVIIGDIESTATEDNSDTDTPTTELTTQPTTESTDSPEPSQPTYTEATPPEDITVSESTEITESTESTENTEKSEPTEQPEQDTEPSDTNIPNQDSADPAQTEGEAQSVQASVDSGKLTISGGTVATGNVAETSKTATALKAGDGTVIVKVVCEEESYTAGVKDTVAVANAVLKPEQIQLVNEGETIEIRVDVKDISKAVPGQDKEVIENGLAECRKDMPDLTLGMYVDISMFIKVGKGDWNAVTSTADPIAVVVGIPEELKEDGREYYIIRSHDGEHTLLMDMDDDPNTITVDTNLFSAYAIAYEQTEGSSKCGLCHICPTFLGICCFIWLAIVLAILLVIWIIVWRKRKAKNEAVK